MFSSGIKNGNLGLLYSICFPREFLSLEVKGSKESHLLIETFGDSFSGINFELFNIDFLSDLYLGDSTLSFRDLYFSYTLFKLSS